MHCNRATFLSHDQGGALLWAQELHHNMIFIDKHICFQPCGKSSEFRSVLVLDQDQARIDIYFFPFLFSKE